MTIEPTSAANVTDGIAESLPETRTVTQAYLDHAGYVSDKWEQYLPIYDFLVADIRSRNKPVDLLEIGVQNGGSLQIWSKVLPAGSKIFGLDIDPKCADLDLPDNVTVKIIDAGDNGMVAETLAGRTFDVIVDDGSHTSSDIIKTFQICFNYLKPGGTYIVEDVHCSYFKSHGGGLGKKDAAVEYFKVLIDAVHADYFEADNVPDVVNAPAFALVRNKIAHVTFFDSVIWIQKLSFEKDGPFRRTLTGTQSPVVSMASHLSLLAIPALRTLLLSGSALTSLAPLMISELISAREALGQSLGAAEFANQRSIDLENELVATREKWAVQERKSVELEQELVAIREKLQLQGQKSVELEQKLFAVQEKLQLQEQKSVGLEKDLLATVEKRNVEQRANSAQSDEINALRSSTSWRITAPLRRLVTFLGL